MSGSALAGLADVARLLEPAGYNLDSRKFAGFDVILGETEYALVAAVEFGSWDDIEENVFDVQAALTQIAAEVPSARTWDLYVVVLIGIAATEASQLAIAEAIEGDTRYARKFVHVGLERDALDRALRPLLPLRAPTALEVEDPLGELRNELRMLNLADDLADAAIGTFRDTNVVSIP